MSKRSRLITMLGLLLVITLTLPNINALPADTKVKVKYCEIALSNTKVTQWEFEGGTSKESDIFKQWDNIAQEGIYILANNTNSTFGTTSKYNVTRYPPNTTWFNEFNPGDGSQTNIPIINVNETHSKFLYVRCFLRVGDYRVFLASYYGGFSDAFYITNDFNLSTGVEPKITTSSSIPHTSIQSNPALCGGGVDQRWVNNGYPGESGLFPNTEPYVIYRGVDLSKRPTSYVNLNLYWVARELPEIDLTTNPFSSSSFYLNNTDKGPFDMYKPFPTGDYWFTEVDTGRQVYKGSLNLTKGYNYTSIVTLINNYTVPVNATVTTSFYSCSGNPTSRGIGNSLYTSNYISQMPYLSSTVRNVSFEAHDPTDLSKGIVNVTYSMVLPTGNLSVPGMCLSLTWYSTKDKEKLASGNYPTLGSDIYPYLSFKTIDPRIEMIKVDNKYQAVFNITQEVYAEANSFNQNVSKDDYVVEIRLYNSSTLNAASLIHTQNASLPYNITRGLTIPIEFIIPIQKGWEGTRFYVQVLNKMIKAIEPHPDFINKYIAILGGTPYFKPGDIAYQYGDTLRFGPDSRVDSEKILLFNPTFYQNILVLNVTNLTDRNFSVSWDGINFGQDSLEVTLYPEQSKDITFWIKANHTPWTTVEFNETMQIDADSKLVTSVNTIEEKHVELGYILQVEPNNFTWFNLNPLNFFVTNPAGQDKQTVFLETLDTSKEKEIGVQWLIQGNEEGLAAQIGKEYWVNITLLNKTNNAPLANATKNFWVDSDFSEEISLVYNFTYGKYILTIDLDTFDNISEKDSTLAFAESENSREYTIPVVITNCYYDSLSGFMHYIDYYGVDKIDQENRCECPADLIMIFGTGYCADPFGDGCSPYPLTECNNWTKTSGLACGWKCEGTSCPPTPIEPGACLSCSNITNTCGGYNNNEACNIDPCQKASLFDCPFLNCDSTKKFGCHWEENTCKFNGTLEYPVPTICNYTISIVQLCTGGAEKMIIQYNTTNIGCTNKTRVTLCGTEVSALPFFTKTNLIISIALIAVFYLFFRAHRKRRLAKKHSKRKK